MKKPEVFEGDGIKHSVAPVRFGLVHLTKPLDLAMIAQNIIATDNMVVDTIGQTLDFNNSKIINKIKSWNIENPTSLLENKSRHYESIEEYRLRNIGRIIGTVVDGGKNPFTYDWQDTDTIIIGGANGLSDKDVDKMDDLITIPMSSKVDFLTTNTVVSALTYHILTKRKFWDK